MRNTAMYSTTKSPLCFVCHGKPDNGQEDFNWCCCCPDNAFWWEWMSKSAKQNMLEHILGGSNNPVFHIMKMHCIHPATMERELHCGNWFNIYIKNHHRHCRLKDTISWQFKHCTIFKAYQDISWIRPSVISLNQRSNSTKHTCHHEI